jgi:hypothetical protein
LKELRGRQLLKSGKRDEHPKAAAEGRRQWIFPQAKRRTNHRAEQQGQQHAHESIVQKAATKRSGMPV